MRIPLAQELDELAVDLDGDHACRTREQRIGQRAASRPDLHHRLASRECHRIGDAREYAWIGEKVLAEALPDWRRPHAIAAQLRVMTTARSSRCTASPVCSASSSNTRCKIASGVSVR